MTEEMERKPWYSSYFWLVCLVIFVIIIGFLFGFGIGFNSGLNADQLKKEIADKKAKQMEEVKQEQASFDEKIKEILKLGVENVRNTQNKKVEFNREFWVRNLRLSRYNEVGKLIGRFFTRQEGFWRYDIESDEAWLKRITPLVKEVFSENVNIVIDYHNENNGNKITDDDYKVLPHYQEDIILFFDNGTCVVISHISISSYDSHDLIEIVDFSTVLPYDYDCDFELSCD